MSLRIIYGRSGTGKSNYIFNEIAENINDSRKKYIITPEQFSFSAEKELLEKVNSKWNVNSVINAEVLTFNRMAYRAFQEIEGASKVSLSKSGKAMLVYDILQKGKEDYKFLTKSNNNIDLVLNQINEFKKHGVSISDVEILRGEVGSSNKYLNQKLEDLYKVYNKYEEKLGTSFIDSNDNLTTLVTLLDEIHDYDDKDIYIDEFTGFTKQEYEIIKKLLLKANRITISVCSDEIDNNVLNDSDIFYSTKITINKLIKLAKDNNVEVEDSIKFDSSKRFKNKELEYLEKNIYENIYEKYDSSQDNIKLFLANNRYSEIENIAKEIIKLLRDENYRYKDIAIITKNSEVYASLIKVLFDRYKIPAYIDEKKSINQNVVIKYILSILDILSKNWSYESVFNYLKSGFVDIEEDDIYLLEEYVLKWNIKGNKWYKEEWNFHDEDVFGQEEIQRLRELRKRIVSPILDLKQNFGRVKTVREITTNLYEFLIKNEIDKKIEKEISYLEENGMLNIASEYKGSWDILMKSFDEIIMLFDDENITFEKYIEMIKIAIQNEDLGTIPQGIDEVIVGDISRTRNHKIKVLFIIGLNDGVFPSVNKAEGFLNDKDRNIIKECGIELAKDTLENIYEDNYNIYKAFSTAEEKLFLSYVSSDNEGKSLRPSIIINKLKKMFGRNLVEESDIVNHDYFISTRDASFDELLMAIRDFANNKEISKEWIEIYKKYRDDDNYKDALKRSLDALNYSNIAERLSRENLDKLYNGKLITSVSKMETYQNCPYSYFLKYDLRLNDKDTSKVEAVDTGTIMHDVIDKFFLRLDENKSLVSELSDEEIENIILEIIDEVISLDRYYIFRSNEKYMHLVKRLKKVVLMSMKCIVRSIKYSSFEVFGHEVEFGENAKYKPIKLYTKSGELVEITGKIDRIDVAKTEDGNYVRIIDYKSSEKSVDLNKVKAGLQIQLLTYLNETCKQEDFLPAAALYFKLDDPINKSKISEEELEETIRKQFKMKGLILADVKVIKMMDNTLEEGKTSDMIPAGLTARGEINGNSTKSGISENSFRNLQKYMDKITTKISEEILSGKIDIKPVYYVAGKRTACEYCKYKSICNFDTEIKGNKYNIIGNDKKEEVLEEINSEVN